MIRAELIASLAWHTLLHWAAVAGHWFLIFCTGLGMASVAVAVLLAVAVAVDCSRYRRRQRERERSRRITLSAGEVDRHFADLIDPATGTIRITEGEQS